MDEHGKACLMQATRNQLPLALTKYCDTPDREVHFNDVTRYFQILHAHLAAFFSDQPITNNYELSDTEKAHFRAYRDELIALYTLAHDAWDFIQCRFDAIGIQISSAGELIRAIIDQDARGLFFICYPEINGGNSFFEFSPRRAYEEINARKRLFNQWWADTQMGRENNSSPVSKALDEMDQYSVLRFYTWAICIDASFQNPTLRRQLKAYELAEKALRDPMFKALHPRHNPRGFSWLKGKLRTAQKHRGFA